MDEAAASRYWCHMCNQRVSPLPEIEEEAIKCPICQGGFIEEMATAGVGGGGVASGGGGGGSENENPFDLGGSESDRALSLWAPILLGMMSNPRRRNRFRRLEFENDFTDDEDDNVFSRHRRRHQQEMDEETELDRELESTLRMRRRSSANILQLLHGIRAGMAPPENSQTENTEPDNNNTTTNNNNRNNRERVILINPFNQTIIVQSSMDSNGNGNGNPQSLPMGSLGDYFMGPGLDLLLQHLAENDPSRYGTPPAQKEAVEALPTVKIEETALQCSVCLDDFEIGADAKEMACKHKFHDSCILPWLELHSSCPVCRYQMPSVSSDESKPAVPEGNNGDGNRVEGEGDEDEDGRNDNDNENGRRFSLPIPWPFSNLFSSSSSSASQSGNATPSSEPSRNVPSSSSSSRTHED